MGLICLKSMGEGRGVASVLYMYLEGTPQSLTLLG